MFLRRIAVGAFPLCRCLSKNSGYENAIWELNQVVFHEVLSPYGTLLKHFVLILSFGEIEGKL